MITIWKHVHLHCKSDKYYLKHTPKSIFTHKIGKNGKVWQYQIFGESEKKISCFCILIVKLNWYTHFEK